MRQRNEVESVARMYDAEFAANYVFQSCTVYKLPDRQAAYGNNEMWLQNPDLIMHPRRAVPNLIWRRDTVSAAGIFARETSTDGGEINLRSNGGFVHSAKLFEPTKECFAGGVRERSFQCGFPRTGRLPNNHHIANDRAS
jgi:hypothetical protein